VFQVMPIFFLVGGYSNALSWRSARRKNTGYAEWLRTRLRRLGLPLIPLLLTWLVTCVIALAAGAAPAAVQLASQMALVPTWFLAAYLLVVIVAPPCLLLWEKWGWWSIILGIGLAGSSMSSASPPTARSPATRTTCSCGRASTSSATPGSTVDSRTSSAALLLFAIGAIGLGLLVGFGPYPVSMITAGTDAISNSAPTRVTMAFLGMAQAGIVLMLQRPLATLLRSPGLWFLTVLVNQRIMTWFLWHLTALTALANVLIGLDATACSAHPADRDLVADPSAVGARPAGDHRSARGVFGRFESPRPTIGPHRRCGCRSPPRWPSARAWRSWPIPEWSTSTG
jgi:hypothetical protein